MADYINLNELSITTQALLKKINEQADLKVDKDEVVQNTQSGDVIATVGDVDIYNGLDIEQLQYELGLAPVAYSGSYNDLEDTPSFYPYVLYASPCNTPYGTAQKSVTVANFSPSQTCLLVVPFTASSTVDTPTLKINNSTTGNIYLGHSGAVNGTTNVLKWSADTTLVFLYDSNSTAFYFITAISRGGVDPARGANTWFGTSGSSSDAGQKVASCDNFVLTRGSLISIKFSNANTYAGQLSLSVNNTGSKVIHKGSITSSFNPLLWEANTTLTFMYTGNVYQYICSNADIPTKVSDLTNDSGYQTQSQVNTLIGTAIGNINQFNVAIVQTLPTTDIDAHTIYFVPQQNAQTANAYEEWMYINSQWEMIGTTSIDLSGYVQQFLVTLTYDDQNDIWSADKTYAQISTALANGYDVLLYDGSSGSYYPYHSTSSAYSDRFSAHNFYNIGNDYNGNSISQHGYWIGNGYIGVIDITYNPDIPTATSDLTNDSGFITSADIPVTDVQDSSGNSLVSNGIATIPTIPTVPTNVSSFTNDAGYLTLSTLPIYDGSVS